MARCEIVHGGNGKLENKFRNNMRLNNMSASDLTTWVTLSQVAHSLSTLYRSCAQRTHGLASETHEGQYRLHKTVVSRSPSPTRETNNETLKGFVCRSIRSGYTASLLLLLVRPAAAASTWWTMHDPPNRGWTEAGGFSFFFEENK